MQVLQVVLLVVEVEHSPVELRVYLKLQMMRQMQQMQPVRLLEMQFVLLVGLVEQFVVLVGLVELQPNMVKVHTTNYRFRLTKVEVFRWLLLVE
jgi:hypothetical protein